MHDAALVERVWGDDLRVEGVVVEPLDGIDDLRRRGPRVPARTGTAGSACSSTTWCPAPRRAGSSPRSRDPHVLVVGHPYVDVWQAVKPAALGIAGLAGGAPRTRTGRRASAGGSGWGDPRDGWRRVLGAVDSYADLEVPLLRAVEELIDFVTAGGTG